VKLFISLILTLGFILNANAQMYYDTERSGEGIVILHQGDLVQFTMFTYTDATECVTSEIPSFGNDPVFVTTCVGGPQAWYVSGSAQLRDGVAHGVVHSTEGCRYPDTCADPVQVANVFEVASWELLQTETGWSVEFLPFRVADPLPLDASFYAGPYTFNQRLFGDVE